MSTFVMSSTGFEQLANELVAHAMDQAIDGLGHQVRGYLSDFELQTFNEYGRLAAGKVGRLERLNTEAVNQRYREHDPIDVEGYRIALGRGGKWSQVQLFANLKCLRYQMSEGTVPQTNEYQELDELIGSVADKIVSTSAEYENAKWGW